MARPFTRELTTRQREILEWIKGFIRANRMPPTVREIGTAFRIDCSGVFQHLQALERKGCLRRGDLGARSLIVKGVYRRKVRKEPPRAEAREEPAAYDAAPLVGRIAAGRPIEAIEHDVGGIPVRKGFVRGKVFALQVAGDSMVEAGILDGDYVIVRKQPTAEEGDIVVARIGEDATLKRFHREGQGVRLDPANSKMSPIRVNSGDFAIDGKVIGVQRYFRS